MSIRLRFNCVSMRFFIPQCGKEAKSYCAKLRIKDSLCFYLFCFSIKRSIVRERIAFCSFYSKLVLLICLTPMTVDSANFENAITCFYFHLLMHNVIFLIFVFLKFLTQTIYRMDFPSLKYTPWFPINLKLSIRRV